jgi:hypothetical protein
MRVDHKKTILKRMNKSDNGYVPGKPFERVSFIWELTKELWFLKEKEDAERRLQRDVTNIIRQ